MIRLRMFSAGIKGIYYSTLGNKPWAPPGVSLIAARRMWPVTQGENVVVAVLDTGVDYTHPDLSANIIGGISVIPGEKDYMDENGHGTHVAGTIAASGSILGVAPRAKILAVKVLNRYGMGNFSSISKGIDWAEKWRGAKGERVNIINMSLGAPLSNVDLHQKVIKAVNSGITIVCAAGNSGDADPDTTEISYPAYYPETLAVGAIDLYTGIASFSNSNDRIDIVAPGVDTYSTYPGKRYVKLSGTSMATPHISGAIALIYSRYNLRFGKFPTPAMIKNLLHYQSLDLGNMGFDTLYGYGLFTFNISGGQSIKLVVGENRFFINNREYVLDTPPFLQKGEPCAAIVELSNLLGNDAFFVPGNNEENGTPYIEIWS
ncbi:MAG: S8 family serine peptidase [Syntrophomonadaceae bacterium]|nr:S8 family serine peptidase [Syntrophomonadaceae bacterium]MDD3889180.1 S8 family serine peptidase [Syntrophomonadaceae bacterium]